MRKVACITGATSGIGCAYAWRLASLGYDLILTGRRKAMIEEVATSIHKRYGVKVTICLVDFTDAQQMARFIAYIQKQDTIDFFVSNAGYGAEASFTKDTVNNHMAMLQTHNIVNVHLAHHIARKMQSAKRGNMIFVSSLAGELILPNAAMYCATKAFLTSFAQSLALELKPFNIHVQVVCPGFVYTDFHSRSQKMAIQRKSIGPLRWMQPDDVVKQSLKRIGEDGEAFFIPGTWNRVGYHVLKFIPKTLYNRGMLRVLDAFEKLK